jgi:beta-lactamase regulating signal transducer with metallopeptidase domain
MESLPVFLLKANVIFTVLFAVYYLLLRKEKFLGGNRFTLLGIVATSVIIPFWPDVVLPLAKSGDKFYNLSELQADVGNVPLFAGRVESPVALSIFTTVFSVGAIFLLIRLIVQVSRILIMINQSKKEEMNGVICCEPTHELPPFSFFRCIVIRPGAFNPEQYRDIIAHELCHCQQLHSIDVLLTEFACIVFWINPLVYVYRREVKLNLEFIADEQVLRSGADRVTYQLNLLSLALRKPFFHITNSFHSSKIRQRIGMMNTELPHSTKKYKYAVIMPLVAMLYVFMNSEQKKTFTEKPIFIDARTTIVKFTEGPVTNQLQSKFEGIYVVKGKIYTERQIRDLMSKNGQLEFIFSAQPILGMHTSNDNTAINKWGKAARNGVIFLEDKETHYN